MDRYILDAAGLPVLATSAEWSRWFSTADRHLGLDQVGPYHVSTVFLGLNHRWGDGPPILWETAIERNGEWDIVERYESREEALAGHAYYLQRVRSVVNGNGLA